MLPPIPDRPLTLCGPSRGGLQCAGPVRAGTSAAEVLAGSAGAAAMLAWLLDSRPGHRWPQEASRSAPRATHGTDGACREHAHAMSRRDHGPMSRCVPVQGTWRGPLFSIRFGHRRCKPVCSPSRSLKDEDFRNSRRPCRAKALGGATMVQVVSPQFCSATFMPLAERLKRSPFEAASSLMTTPFSFLR